MSLKTGTQFRGLVNALNSAGASVGGIDGWCIVFNLAAWEIDGGIQQGKLRCEFPVSKLALNNLMQSIKPYSIVDVSVAEFTDKGVAILNDVRIYDGMDEDFAAIRNVLSKPIRLETKEFGVLELDRRFDDYVGEIEWCGSRVNITLSCADYSSPTAVLEVASALFSAQVYWSKHAKEFAADRLLSLKNETWLQDLEDRLSHEDFIARMILNDISVDESGIFNFYHDDGDLFWGHTIIVNGHITGGLKDAEIAG